MLEAKIDMLRANLEAARKDRPDSSNGGASSLGGLEAELTASQRQAAQLKAQRASLQQQQKSAESTLSELRAKVRSCSLC